MRILLINQSFYPDVIAVAQYATGLTVGLAERGHEVTVLTGNHAYDDPGVIYPKSDEHRRVQITRIPYSRLGRKDRTSRLFDLLSFHLSLALRLCFTPKQDIVVGMTLPPFMAFWSALFCRLKGGKHIYWVMDMNPDEAFAAGWLSEKSMIGKILFHLERWIFKQSVKIVALDRFMKDRIINRCDIEESKISVIAPWAHDEFIHPVDHAENSFRKKHGLGDKFVVMYSGNHSVCHPLETLLKAALHCRSDKQIIFCSVGGGVRTKEVERFKKENALENILQLPYEPLERLAESLSAADLHITTMGNDYVGIVHPCKVYGILSVGRPFVLIGPRQSDMGEWMEQTGLGEQIEHGDVPGLVHAIEKVRRFGASEKETLSEKSIHLKNSRFGLARLEEFIKMIEDQTCKS